MSTRQQHDSPDGALAVATHFAPAGREPPAELRRQEAMLARVPLLAKTLDAMSNMVVILNGHRQIVAANQRFLGVLRTTMTDVSSKRPGESLGCIRADDAPDGCGTGLYCLTCGAVQAIWGSMKEMTQVVRECRILVKTPAGAAPLDLRVTAAPFQVEDEYFTLASIEDIGHEKLVAVLQRAFFHDVLNTAGCIHGYADYLASESSLERGVCQHLVALSTQLVEEIQSQRDMLHAEAGELHVQPGSFCARHVLDDLRGQYAKHPAGSGRRIQVGRAWEGMIVSDRLLLRRVLANMVKNALEATPQGGTVTLECAGEGEAVTFTVHNPEVMPEAVQRQVFQRSFSTKGQPGRGIGTYGMKLLGERYLGGRVDFTSQEPEGTTFRLTLPLSPPA